MKRFINNIPVIKLLIILLGALSFCFSNIPIPTENTFLFCLKSEVELLNVNRENDILEVDNIELNDFIFQNGLINIERWLPNATEMDKDGDIYLNRIYRAYVPENHRINILSIIDGISSLSIVEYAESEYIRKPFYTPNDPLVELQCSLNSVKTKAALDFWDIPSGNIPDGRHVLLASVDTGVDYTHPDLQNNSWINQGEIPSWMFEAGIDLDSDQYIEASEVVSFLISEGYDVNNDGQINLRDAVSDGSPFEDNQDNDGNGYEDDILGWDNSGWYGPDDNDPFPKEDVAPNGTWAHGTHVAGILAATSDNNLGMASTSYNAKYISVKVSRENQNGEPGISDGYQGILYAAKAGYFSGSFAIINNSWGGGGYSASENSTINTAQDTYGAIVLGAAGNGYDSGGEQYGSHYPSSYDNCISVCAMGCSGNWGNWATYHHTVDLAAPGENIQSAIIGSGYESWDGSSMACPNAASAIGLLSSYYPTWNNLQLRSRIEESADRIVYELNPDYETCNGLGGEDCFGHGMVDVYKAIGMDFSPSLSISSVEMSINSEDDIMTLQDNDNVLNPGESGQLEISLLNENGWANASSVIATLTSENPNITILNSTAAYGNINDGISVNADFEFSLSLDVSLGNLQLFLNVEANGLSGYDYSTVLPLEINVNLFQENFPYDINSEVRSSPVIANFDSEDDNEIVFADYTGLVHYVKNDQEIFNDTFPFDTGDQIWGSIASADLDNDNNLDFVVTSKSGFIYVFDQNGLKAEYDAGRWLIGTPVIGNLDSDEDLEIVIGGYQSPTSSSPLFVINSDGSDVSGFPYIIGEKMKAGVALANMNDNEIDDIVFGTDTDLLHVLLDGQVEAPGFPIDVGNNLRSDPVVLDIGDEKIILIGCSNDNFYAFNYSDASLRFVVPTAGDINTSAAFKEGQSGVEIYFGSDDGHIYGVDINGNSLDGFPYNTGGSIVGSIVFSDLNGDDSLDLIAVNASGQLFALNQYVELLDYFPISYQFPFTSPPMIVDYDLDGDFEIVCGTGGDLVLVDYKFQSQTISDSWSVFKGNYERNGFYSSLDSEQCVAGDLNTDNIINILDIVLLVNIVVSGSSDILMCAADLNDDSVINILDIVTLVNIVVNSI